MKSIVIAELSQFDEYIFSECLPILDIAVLLIKALSK